MSADGGKPPPPPPGPADFVPEEFCDGVYDYTDDNLADEMDDMEGELSKGGAGGAGQGGGGGGGSSSSIEASVKTCCDKVQKGIQKEFDQNIDILDRYIKKIFLELAATAAGSGGGGGANNGAAAAPAPAAGGWNAGAGAAAAAGVTAPSSAAAPAAAGKGGEVGEYSAASSAKGGADAWLLDVDVTAPPRRLEEAEALDAEIQQLRKRRREGLRGCAANVRRRARENAVLMDVKDYVDVLKVGEASSFNDNGLTPLPTKVQEAVQSCAELKVTAARAQDLTRRLEREQAMEGAGSAAGGGGSSSGPVASTVPPPRDLQAMFQRSSEQQVIAGGATEYSALETRLRG